jgi:hypothetical protein
MAICKALGTVFDTHILWSAWPFLKVVQRFKLHLFHTFRNTRASNTVARSEVPTVVLLRSLEGDVVSLGERVPKLQETLTQQHSVTTQMIQSLNIVYAGFWLHKYNHIKNKIKGPFSLIYFNHMAVLHIFMTCKLIRHDPEFTLLWGPPKNGVKALCLDHTRNGGKFKMWEW